MYECSKVSSHNFRQYLSLFKTSSLYVFSDEIQLSRQELDITLDQYVEVKHPPHYQEVVPDGPLNPLEEKDPLATEPTCIFEPSYATNIVMETDPVRLDHDYCKGEHPITAAFRRCKKFDGVVVYYECEICKLPYLDHERFKAHYINHLRYKHRCDICKKQFRTESDLETHRRLKHSRSSLCPICGKLLKMAYMAKHILTHSNRKIPCLICGKGFRSKDSLYKHKKNQVCQRPERSLINFRLENICPPLD